MTRLIEPAPRELAPLVRYLHAETGSAGSHLLPAMPFPVIGLLIAGGTRLDIDGLGAGKPTPRVFLVGPLTRPSTLHLKPGTQFVTAVLQAGALPSFFAGDARRFANRVTNLGELWPAAVLDRLVADLVPGTPDKVAISYFSILLAGLACATYPPLHIPERLWETPIAELAAEAGYSTRHFQRLVGTHFGFPPRELKRFSRYLAALRGIMGGGGNGRPLAQLAADSGYFDQAHMAHDFRRLAGLSPHSLHHGLAARDNNADRLYFVRYDKKHWPALGIEG